LVYNYTVGFYKIVEEFCGLVLLMETWNHSYEFFNRLEQVLFDKIEIIMYNNGAKFMPSIWKANKEMKN